MPVLQNAKHEQFAQLVAHGEDLAQAYAKVQGHTKITQTTYAGASIWNKRHEIATRKHEIQAAGAASTVLSMAEKRQFLADIVRCSVRELPEDSPLLQSIKTSVKRGQGQEQEEVTEYKVPDKLKALELDAKLSGELETRDRHEILNLSFLQVCGTPAQRPEEPVIDLPSAQPEQLT